MPLPWQHPMERLAQSSFVICWVANAWKKSINMKNPASDDSDVGLDLNAGRGFPGRPRHLPERSPGGPCSWKSFIWRGLTESISKIYPSAATAAAPCVLYGRDHAERGLRWHSSHTPAEAAPEQAAWFNCASLPAWNRNAARRKTERRHAAQPTCSPDPSEAMPLQHF